MGKNELAKLRTEAIAYFEEIKARPSLEGAHKLTEIVQRARDEARRNKSQRAPLMAFAAKLEGISADVLSTAKAQDVFLAEMGEKWQREHNIPTNP
jgi:hypothetical protein